MFEKNYIFYNNKRINELSNPNIKINIHGSENEIFIQDFFGDGILDIKIEGNRNIFKLGKNNRINNTLTIDFHSVEDGTPEECSILIGDGNEFNGNVSIVSSSEPGTVISVGNNNLFANKISLRGAAFHLLFNMQTMEPLNKEEGISIGSQNWICDDVLFLNKPALSGRKKSELL